MDLMDKQRTTMGVFAENNPVTTYHEKKIGNKLYRVTSVYLGKIELAKALEDLTVRKILRQENAQA